MRAEYTLVDGRSQVRQALTGLTTDISYTLRGRYPQAVNDGVLITCCEYANTATENPLVDKLVYQVDIWAFDWDTVLELAALVNAALTELGLRRQYSGPDTIADDPAGYLRKTYRFGRNVDKRTMRLID